MEQVNVIFHTYWQVCSIQILFLTEGIKTINSEPLTENIRSAWCAENETKDPQRPLSLNAFKNSHWQPLPHAPKIEAFIHVEVSCSQRNQFRHAQTNPELGQAVSLGGRVSEELCLGHCLIPASSWLPEPAWQLMMLCTEQGQGHNPPAIFGHLQYILVFSLSRSLIKRKIRSLRAANVTSTHIYCIQSLQPQLINSNNWKETLLNSEVSFPLRLPTAFPYIISFFNILSSIRLAIISLLLHFIVLSHPSKFSPDIFVQASLSRQQNLEHTETQTEHRAAQGRRQLACHP